jgi:hypothetical protein
MAVNPKLTKNCIEILLSLPTTKFVMTQDKTNIQAKEKRKMPTLMLEFNDEAMNGAGNLKTEIIVVRAFSKNLVAHY